LRPDASALLAWYDRNRRRLPWRAVPGETADPYRVWLSEIMLQQTTVATVAPYYARFLSLWPDVRALAAAPLTDVLAAWAGLGYYARARNLHACAAAVVLRHCGRFPSDPADLRALPGIGSYTAAAIAAIAFGHAAVPVDGNVQRVLARWHAVAEPLPAGRRHIEALAADLAGDPTVEVRAGDFAQALMDLGATICTPQRPACPKCPWNAACAAALAGRQEAFPNKPPKRVGRLRRGAAFVVHRADGRVLVRTRPSSGLLGGMTEVPTSAWSADFDPACALDSAPPLKMPGRPRAIAWRRLPEPVAHVFTHFPLELAVYVATVPARTRPPDGMRFLDAEALEAAALPTLMRKVIAAAESDSR
jgi:A/G-specific adenine glycosylase